MNYLIELSYDLISIIYGHLDCMTAFSVWPLVSRIMNSYIYSPQYRNLLLLTSTSTNLYIDRFNLDQLKYLYCIVKTNNLRKSNMRRVVHLSQFIGILDNTGILNRIIPSAQYTSDNVRDFLLLNNYKILLLFDDGTVGIQSRFVNSTVNILPLKDIVAISGGVNVGGLIYFLNRFGKVYILEEDIIYDMYLLSDIIQISIGQNHGLFVDANGYIFATGKNIHNSKKVGTMILKRSGQEREIILRKLHLDNIIQVCAGNGCSTFLRKDGIVFTEGQINILQTLDNIQPDFSIKTIDNLPMIIYIVHAHYLYYNLFIFLDKEGNIYCYGNPYQFMSHNTNLCYRLGITNIYQTSLEYLFHLENITDIFTAGSSCKVILINDKGIQMDLTGQLLTNRL